MTGSYSKGSAEVDQAERDRLSAERDRIRATYLQPRDERPPSSARGAHTSPSSAPTWSARRASTRRCSASR